MPLQAQITSNAAGFLGGYLAAALLSALTSLACLAVACLALPGTRAGRRKFGAVWRERPIPRWFLLAGLVGSCCMVAQAMSVGSIGLALFAVAVVGARTLTSIVIDVIGFSPAGKQPVTRIRILGAALLVSSQPSMNGRAGQAHGSTTTATAINHRASTAGLPIAMAVLASLKIESSGFSSAPLWWMYLAGPLGILFVVTGGSLVPRLGAWCRESGWSPDSWSDRWRWI